jgi:hypothetical protein
MFSIRSRRKGGFWEGGNQTKIGLPPKKNTNSGSKLQEMDYDKCVNIIVVVK